MNKIPNQETIKAIEEARNGNLEEIENIDAWLEELTLEKKKLPRWLRLFRYGFNCMWYHVLFPLGTKQDGFIKK